MPEQQVDSFAEMANRNLYGPTGYDRLEFLPQLRGRRRAEIYREMSQNDALIGAILFAIEMILRRVAWNVEPASPDGADIERADFLTQCMEDMSHTWEELISQALTMLPFGHAALEIVYKHRSSSDPMADGSERTRFPDGKVGWRKFALIPHETIDEWRLDETGGIEGIVQGGTYGTERVHIPVEKLVLFRTDARAPQGISVLRTVVASWYHRKRIQEIEGIGIERDLAGLPVFYIDVDTLSNEAKAEEYRKIIRNLRRDEQEGVLLPAVVDQDTGQLTKLSELTLLTSGGARQFNTSEIINRYAREIAVALLQDIVLLGHEKVGTQALASEKRDLSDTALQAWLNDIAATLNQHAVPRLFALNGMDLANLPSLKPDDIRPTDVEEFFAALGEAAAAGFTFSGDDNVEAFIRHKLGLPPMPVEGSDG